MALRIESFEDNHLAIGPDVYSLIDEDDGYTLQIEVTSGGEYAHPIAGATTLEEPESGCELVLRPPITDMDKLNEVTLAFGSLLRTAGLE